MSSTRSTEDALSVSAAPSQDDAIRQKAAIEEAIKKTRATLMNSIYGDEDRRKIVQETINALRSVANEMSYLNYNLVGTSVRVQSAIQILDWLIARLFEKSEEKAVVPSERDEIVEQQEAIRTTLDELRSAVSAVPVTKTAPANQPPGGYDAVLAQNRPLVYAARDTLSRLVALLTTTPAEQQRRIKRRVEWQQQEPERRAAAEALAKAEERRRKALLRAVVPLLPTEPFDWARHFRRFLKRNAAVYFHEGKQQHDVHSVPLLLLSTYARDMVWLYGHKIMPTDFWVAGVRGEAAKIMAAEPDTMTRIVEMVQYWSTTGELPAMERVLATIDRIPLADERRLDWSDERIEDVKNAVRALYKPNALDDAAAEKMAALLKLAVFDAIGDVPRLTAVKRDMLTEAERRRLGAHPNYFENYYDRPQF